MYYKAEICLMSEEFVSEGVPLEGSMQDHGILETVTDASIRGLFSKLARRFNLKDFEVFENRLEIGMEIKTGDTTYSLKQTSIYITGVEETEIHANILNDFLKEQK